MPVRLVILLLCLLPKITKPQSVSTLMGGRSAALGSASATLKDEWAIFNNIAGISSTTSPSASFSYSVNPSLPGANLTAFSTGYRIKPGALGIGIFRFGDDLYSEQIISTGFGNTFGLASLGISANYIQYRAEGFGTKTALGINFGGIAEITDEFLVGAHITNLNQPKLKSDIDENLSSKLALGVQLIPKEKLSIFAEIEKDLRYKPTIKGGVEYGFLKKFDFRTGFNLNPNSFAAGVGFRSYRLHIDYSINYTQYIRTRFQLSATYQFRKQQGA